MQQEDKYEQVSLGDSTVKNDAQGDVAVPTSTPAASVSERSVSPKREEADHHRQEEVSYPKVEADDDPAQLVKEREAWNSSKLPQNSSSSQTANPYIATSPLPSSDNKGFVYNVRDVLGKWGKKVGDATKRAEDFTGDFWQHLKTGPSIADTAMERIAQGTKVLTEGGYEKIFRQSFETSSEEKLEKTFACYLSTTAGPVIGTLYLSTEKLAFCSDEPLSYKSDGDKTEWSFYKVVLPLHQLKFANPSANRNNPAEKYIQVISTDSHEFWFMGFVNYEKALKSLQSLAAEDKL